MTTLAEVKSAQPDWFSRDNRRFFNDVGYRILHGKVSRRPFLVRSTYMWSDMFGSPKRLCYRVNPLADDLKIKPLVDTQFRDLEEVREWLKEA